MHNEIFQKLNKNEFLCLPDDILVLMMSSCAKNCIFAEQYNKRVILPTKGGSDNTELWIPLRPTYNYSLSVCDPVGAWTSSPACTWHCSLHYRFLQTLFPHGVTVGHTRAFISRIFVEIRMLWLFHTFCSDASITCAVFNLVRNSVVHSPSSVIRDPRYGNVSTCSSCSFW